MERIAPTDDKSKTLAACIGDIQNQQVGCERLDGFTAIDASDGVGDLIWTWLWRHEPRMGSSMMLARTHN